MAFDPLLESKDVILVTPPRDLARGMPPYEDDAVEMRVGCLASKCLTFRSGRQTDGEST